MRRVLLRSLAAVGLVVAGLVVAPEVAHAAAPTISLSSTDLDFGSRYLGDDASIDIVVTNTGTAPVSPNFAGGAPADGTNYDASQNCAGVTLDPGDTCTFTYTFQPTTAGSHPSSTTIGIGVLDDDVDHPITLAGTGLFPITAAPTDLDFGTIPVNSTKAIDVVITNVGTAPVTPNFAGGAPADPTNFDASQDCAGVPLDPGDTCSFTYTFQPTTVGPHTSSTTIGIGVLDDDVDVPITLGGCGDSGGCGQPPSTTTSSTTTTTTAPTSTTPPTVVGTSTTSTTSPTATTSPTTGGSTTPTTEPTATTELLYQLLLLVRGQAVVDAHQLVGALRRRRAGLCQPREQGP